MTERRAMTVLLAAAMLLPGIAGTGAGTRQSGELVLRVAMQDDMKGLNPLTVSDVWSWNVLGYIYDGPMNANPDTEELIPYIAVGSASISGKADSWDDCAIGNFGYSPASSWQNQSKREAIIFYDFENVRWHDGEQMDIRDIMFSMHLAAQFPEWSQSMNPLKADNFTSTGWLEVYKVWEDGTRAALKFRQQEPYAEFFRDTLSTFLLPEHIWAYKISGQAVDGAKIWCDPGYHGNSTYSWQVAPATAYNNDPPIGSGPFKFEFWDKGSLSKVSTFREHFFRHDYKYKEYVGTDEYGLSLARQPNIDGITYKIYKTAEAAVLALKNYDIDYIAWSVPPTYVQDLSNTPGVALQQSPESGFFYLAYNMRKPSFGYNGTGEDVGKPLRQAIAHCIDKDRIVTRLLLNLGVAGTGPVPPFSKWYNASIPTYDFNSTKAKQILADAGYKVKLYSGEIVEGEEAIARAGNGNWWVKPDGSNIGSSTGGKIEILAPESNYDIMRWYPWAMIGEQLRAIGIYAEIVAMDFGSIVDRMDNRDFDMYISGWRIGSEPTEFLHAFYHSSNVQVGQNYAGYQNSSFDSVIDLARSTGDPAVKKDAIFEAQASICYDLPNDVLYFRTNIEAYRSDRFVGWVVGDTASIFNRESVMNIRAPSPFKANAQFVSPPSAVVSDSTTPLSIIVKDQDGNPVEGAAVKLNCSAGALSSETGTTGSNGKLDLTFTAPYADPSNMDAVINGTPVIINIEYASYVSPGGVIYDPAPGRLAMIRVYPEDAVFLSVRVSADPDIINPDIGPDGTPGFTYVDVHVTDQNGDPVVGANVALIARQKVIGIEPETQATDAQGMARFTVTVLNLSDDDGSLKEYILTAVAVHPENTNILGENHMSLYIVDAIPSEPPPPPRTYTGETFLAIAAVCVAAFFLSILLRRRKKL